MHTHMRTGCPHASLDILIPPHSPTHGCTLLHLAHSKNVPVFPLRKLLVAFMPTHTCSCPQAHTYPHACAPHHHKSYLGKRGSHGHQHTCMLPPPKKASNPHSCLCTHAHLSTSQSLRGFWCSPWSLCRFQDTDFENMFVSGHIGQPASSQANRFEHLLKFAHRQRFGPTLPTSAPRLAPKLPLPA